MSETPKCPAPVCVVCDYDRLESVIRINAVPVHCAIYYKNPSEAHGALRATLDLHFCPQCGHIQNAEFNPGLLHYGPDYENTQAHSPRFRRYLRTLAKRLVRAHDLHKNQILEIGCGQGDFLKLLCRLGQNHGIGVDPALQPAAQNSLAAPIRFIQGEFDPAGGHLRGSKLVCFRHVLEHLNSPFTFLRTLRTGIEPGAIVYCEVPNSEPMISGKGVWDLLYEHRSYFTRASLRQAFSRAGFRVHSLRKAFGGQFLSCEAVADSVPQHQVRYSPLPFGLGHFRIKAGKHLSKRRQEIENRKMHGERIGIWGAGSKGVMLANQLQPNAVECLIDINPRKQGKYIACRGYPVLAPSDLAKIKLDRILITNPAYKCEIARCVTRAGASCVLEQI